MLEINMFSSADKVKGQGVGSVYLDLIKMLKKDFPNSFNITLNKFKKADVTHYHTIDLIFYFSTFFKKRRGRRIGYVHFVPDTLEGSLDLPWLVRIIFYRYVVLFYKRMDHLVVVNPSFILELEKLGIPAEKITYIPNFVSSKTFYEREEVEKAQIREKKNIAKDQFLVLGAGQIQERKGIDDFVKLAEENPELQFVWAGGFSFGKMTSGYERYKKIYENPPANLIFTGIIPREELSEYYNIATLFLLPSYNELFPMCILEAYSCGTPVMLRDLELYHSIIENDYIAASDGVHMSQLLKKLKNSPTELIYYKEQAKLASKKYSEQNLSRVWYDFYNEQAQLYSYHVQSE